MFGLEKLRKWKVSKFGGPMGVRWFMRQPGSINITNGALQRPPASEEPLIHAIDESSRTSHWILY